MKATFKEGHAPRFTVSHRKEEHFKEEFAAIAIDTTTSMAYTAVTLRIYETNARSYCCLWIHDNASWTTPRTIRFWENASGWAGGYGYHRASAAAADAIKNCGVNLSEDINGRGSYAISEAVHAIAAEMWPDCTIYIQHAHA